MPNFQFIRGGNSIYGNGKRTWIAESDIGAVHEIEKSPPKCMIRTKSGDLEEVALPYAAIVAQLGDPPIPSST